MHLPALIVSAQNKNKKSNYMLVQIQYLQEICRPALQNVHNHIQRKQLVKYRQYYPSAHKLEQMDK